MGILRRHAILSYNVLQEMENRGPYFTCDPVKNSSEFSLTSRTICISDEHLGCYLVLENRWRSRASLEDFSRAIPDHVDYIVVGERETCSSLRQSNSGTQYSPLPLASPPPPPGCRNANSASSQCRCPAATYSCSSLDSTDYYGCCYYKPFRDNCKDNANKKHDCCKIFPTGTLSDCGGAGAEVTSEPGSETGSGPSESCDILYETFIGRGHNVDHHYFYTGVSHIECAKQCHANSQCMFWTYNLPPKNCWLKKDDLSGYGEKNDWMSGNKGCGEAAKYPIIWGLPGTTELTVVTGSWIYFLWNPKNGNGHNVIEVTKKQFEDDCESCTPETCSTTRGDKNYVLKTSQTGTFYFASGVGTDCEKFKAAITVVK